MTTGFKLASPHGVTLAICALASVACKTDPKFENRPLVVYAPRSCPVAQDGAFAVIYGNGDFADASAGVSSVFLRDVGAVLDELPANTRSVIVDVSNPAQNGDWRGIASVASSGPVHVLVWPGGKACRLTRNVEPRADMSFGVFGHHVMIAGGSLLGRVPQTFVGDLTTGIVAPLAFGLGTRRAHATITAFGTGADSEPSPALVAGGENPDTQSALGTAEVYMPKSGASGDIGEFDTERIELSEPRTRHGAVVLATGETLLVGGTGQFGAPLATMELVDPRTRRHRSSGVALLEVPRINPMVLRLASGEILVAGGLDANQQPIPTLEWFSPDANQRAKRPVDLVVGRDRAIVPLETGGALAVVIPSSAVADFKSVWVISADGTLEPGVPIDAGTLDRVRLFRGAEGAPILWTGRRWMRYLPWSGAFQPMVDAPPNGPDGPAIASGDGGLALWLEGRIEGQLYVTGYRFATRSRYGAVKNPLLVEGTLGLAPDRLPTGSMRFDAGKGLALGAGESAFVTDVTYASVDVELDVSAAVSLVLRQEDGRELFIGGAECPFAEPPKSTLRIEREGLEVRVRVDGNEPRRCATDLGAEARVSVGVRGGEGGGVARNLRIFRR